MLVLVGQVAALPVVEVVAADAVGGLAEEVLRAALRGQVGVIARVLGHLMEKIGNLRYTSSHKTVV